MAAKPSKIKVLFTIPNFDTAGSGKALLKIACGLNRELFDPHIACFHNRGAFFKTVEASGIPIHIFQFTCKVRPVWKGLWDCWQRSRFFRSNKFDIVHSYHYAADYSEALAVRMAGIKWGFTKKNMNWGGSSKNSWKLRSALANFIAVQNKDMIREFYPGSGKTWFLPRGVDTSEFHPAIRDEELLSGLGIDRNARIVMNVANMVPVKGLDVLINAFSKSSFPNSVLILVGDNNNEYGTQLSHLVEESGLKNRVIFTGKRPDISRFLSVADLFVLPTLNEGRKEGSPVALLEAMACGVPVIGTRISGIKDQLANFSEFLVTAGDVDALHQKMEEVLAMPQDKLKNLRQRLVDEVQNSFTLKREITRHEEMYKKWLKRK